MFLSREVLITGELNRSLLPRFSNHGGIHLLSVPWEKGLNEDEMESRGILPSAPDKRSF